MIPDNNDRQRGPGNDTTDPLTESKGQQQQSDPQLTELSGFTDPKEDLEPTLEDGTKGPEKLKEENEHNTVEENKD